MNRLYLGSDSPVKDVNVMTTLEISLVISVTEEPVPEESRWPNISYQHIEAGDFPDEDLISHFDHCYRLIAKAHEKDETVYIHCRSGTSRSATIVMAFLMKKHCISYLNSRKRVEKKRKVFPNEGFVHQLELYERMNFFANGYNQEYRRFLLKSLTYKLRSNGLSLGLTNNLQSKSPKATSRAERDMKFHYEYNCLKNYFKKIVAAEQTGDQFYDSTDTGPVYTCYYCNHELFNQINIITEKVSDYSCRDLFIEPLQTYCTQSDDETSGYLKCPNWNVSH
ncbi:unnamed protein product [Oppiella nova]|uniref:protein-tyrosine-phosphatase n=1 Tax=Oppiella nova TaxID=334625 RepID=A0A7R9M7C6_9ACAR|nr:unnamed protein product [Oppiella nova]CAG2172147.1 unnamed protein product [Oppiella nova]